MKWTVLAVAAWAFSYFTYSKSTQSAAHAQELKTIQIHDEWSELAEDIAQNHTPSRGQALNDVDREGIYAARGRVFSCDPVFAEYATGENGSEVPVVASRVTKQPFSYSGARMPGSIAKTVIGLNIQLEEDWDNGPKEGHNANISISGGSFRSSLDPSLFQLVYEGEEPFYQVLSDQAGDIVKESVVEQHTPMVIVGEVRDRSRPLRDGTHPTPQLSMKSYRIFRDLSHMDRVANSLQSDSSLQFYTALGTALLAAYATDQARKNEF
eukprot:TRINITY_DN11520_c0_g1_i1.p1 TRINITY_DN11520_c0_g1~~TRINITY_DN11520_c0_g1_i1.p1  ORF type:complete len:307 (-),score=73.58 TRINITY_DN11520_c0_g1_i1:83-883(-)